MGKTDEKLGFLHVPGVGKNPTSHMEAVSSSIELCGFGFDAIGR